MEKYNLRLIETCLRTGYHKVIENTFDTYDAMKEFLSEFCKDRGLELSRIYSRYRSVAKGTAEGVKVFYSPEPGTRIYVWIELSIEKGLGIS